MSPRQDLVDNGFCLAEPGSRYFVYLESLGVVNISIVPGEYSVLWIDARNTNKRIKSKPTTSGQNLKSPKTGDDWLVYLERTEAALKQNPECSRSMVLPWHGHHGRVLYGLRAR
jgi:hypothetical protein